MNPILAEEIESLEIIYPDLFTKSSDRELDITVDINSGTEDYLGLKISLFFTEDYPNLGPIFTLKGINNFDVDNDSLKEAINSSIDRNIGNPMIFDIIDSIKNWLENHFEKQQEIQAIKNLEEKSLRKEEFKNHIEKQHQEARSKKELEDYHKNLVNQSELEVIKDTFMID